RFLARLSRLLVGAALVLACWPTSLAAQAQATTGVIRGTVSDPSGNVVVGALVTLTDMQTRFQRTVTTNEKGVFVAPLLPLGTYEARARAVGLGERRQTGIVLRVGETVDLALKLAPVELAAVTVTATPVVDVRKVASSTFNLDAVQEVVVTAGGASAEFGRSGSGFVNVITKSGTNEVKGSLHYFGKYDWLSADLAHGTQTLTPDFRQHQFGFTLGGPL